MHDAHALEGVLDAAVPPASVEVLGIPLALTDYERTMDWMDATIGSKRRGYVCVAAVHTVMVCREDPELRRACDEGHPYVMPEIAAVAAAIDESRTGGFTRTLPLVS